MRLATATVLIAAGIAVGTAARAGCLSDPDSSPQCRYPAGDGWCRDNAPGRPYAFNDGCMRDLSGGAGAQSAWDRCAERAEESVDYRDVGMSGINRAILDACGPNPGANIGLPAARTGTEESHDQCAARFEVAATMLSINDPSGTELRVFLTSLGARTVDELVRKECGTGP